MPQFTEGHEFEEAGRGLIEGAKAGLWVAGKEVLALSDVLVPKDTEVLRRSGRVDETGLGPQPRTSAGFFMTGDPYATVGYGYGMEVNPKTGHLASEYAVAVHERTDQYHEPPTQAKFLETAVYAYSSQFGNTVGEMMIAFDRETKIGTLKGFLDWRTLVERRIAETGQL